MSAKKKCLLMLLLSAVIAAVPFIRVNAAETAEEKELKVLVIEINPYLETKKMKVTDFLNTSPRDA